MNKPTNHYGVWVDKDVPTTGVVSNNDAEWLHEETDSGIDLDYEELLTEYEDNPLGFFDEYCVPEDERENFDFGDYTSMMGDSTYLIGGWIKDSNGQYEPDVNSEYSAIYGTIYTQVVHSQYVTRASLCSPCYPGQGDVPSEGEYLVFTLPPEIWGDRLDNEELTKVKVETANYQFNRYYSVMESWLHKRATIREVKAAHKEAKSIMDKLA